MKEIDADFWTTEAMLEYGGSFVHTLAQLARLADSENLEKLKSAFPEYWEQYMALGRTMHD